MTPAVVAVLNDIHVAAAVADVADVADVAAAAAVALVHADAGV